MNVSIKKGNLEEQVSDPTETRRECDLLILNTFSKVKTLSGATKDVDVSLEKKLSSIMKEEGFKGGKGETLMVRTDSKRVLLMGLGEKKDFDTQVVREISAIAYKNAKALKANNVVSILHGAGGGKLPAADCARAQAEGVLLGAYEFNKLKKTPDEKPHEVESWEIVTNHTTHAKNAKAGLELGELVAKGTITARDLVNEPAQEMHPKALAKVAEKIAKDSGGKIKVKVYTKAEIKKMGMGGLLGVNQGSDREPVFVHMQYKSGKPKKRVSLVGKAVTFDSGGLSLKPSQYMETMKCDMAGSASVLGVFSVLSELKPKLHVDGIFAATENMPSGSAIRPGDVLKAMNGKTMEVLNTDAEGRLTLADALSYACDLKPNYIIDLATLTGSCVAALGEEISGVMGNNDKLTNKLEKSAQAAGEKLWSLPLEKNYKKLIESKIADVKNIGGKYGGAITAGLFLQEFVEENIPWAHIDIAGPAFAEREINSYTMYGGTGVGVATLIEFLRTL